MQESLTPCPARLPEQRAITFPEVLQSGGPGNPTPHSPSSDAMSPARLGWLVLWMSGTLAAFIVAAVSVRALSSSLNAFEMMTVRSAGGLVILAAMAALRPDLRRSVRVHRMTLQSLRNLVHFGSQICWTIAITLLPFATVFALEFTIPAFVTALAVVFLGERLTASRAGALAVCLIGVVVILRPGFAAFQPAMLLMVLGSLLFGVTYTAAGSLPADVAALTREEEAWQTR